MIKQYHLHKNDYSKLHFEVEPMRPYFEKHREHCIKPHRHSFYQILWFYEASQHFVDFEVHEVPAQSLMFLDKNQVHYFCPKAANQGMLIHFNDYFLVQEQEAVHKSLRYLLFNGLDIPYSQIAEQDPHFTKAQQLLGLIQEELKQVSLHQKDMLYHLFNGFLVLLERIKRQQTTQLESQHMSDDYTQLFAFRKTIEQNLANPLTVQAIADELQMNSKKLSALTQTYLHQTPAQVITERKTLEAKRLLSNTSLSIKEVAYALGFDQATYFTKFFKKQTTLTPKEFRASLP